MILRLNYFKITEKQKEVISKSYTKTFKYLVKKCCQNKNSTTVNYINKTVKYSSKIVITKLIMILTMNRFFKSMFNY